MARTACLLALVVAFMTAYTPVGPARGLVLESLARAGADTLAAAA